MRRLVNLTPHAIRVIKEGETVFVFSPSGVVARLNERVTDIGSIPVNGTNVSIPVIQKEYTSLNNLPDPVEGTMYICSLHVAQFAWGLGRTDICAPGNLVRDTRGKVLGCESLSMNPEYEEFEIREEKIDWPTVERIKKYAGKIKDLGQHKV